jgi:hypothetical protein
MLWQSMRPAEAKYIAILKPGEISNPGQDKCRNVLFAPASANGRFFEAWSLLVFVQIFASNNPNP